MRGQRPVTEVPDVVGLSAEDACAIVRGARLVPAGANSGPAPSAGVVIAQRPIGAAGAEAGGTVVLWTQSGPGVSWNGVVGVVGTFSQPLSMSANEDARDLVDVTVSALASRAADGFGNDEMLNIWTAHVTHSGAWYKLLQAATKEPQFGLQLRSALLESDGLFRKAETRPAAIDLAATLSPLIEGDEHAQLEQIAIDLPEFEQDENRRAALEVATDQVLVVLDASRVQTDAAKERLDEIARTGSEPPVPAGATWPMVRSEPMTDDDRWHLWGVESAEESQAAQAAVARLPRPRSPKGCRNPIGGRLSRSPSVPSGVSTSRHPPAPAFATWWAMTHRGEDAALQLTLGVDHHDTHVDPSVIVYILGRNIVWIEPDFKTRSLTLTTF